MISEVKSIRPGQPFHVGIYLAMDKNWHTYWLNPGDSGLATQINWNLPQGFKAGAIQWPCPRAFGKAPTVSYGYEKEVLLIVEITPQAAGEIANKIDLFASVDWIACREECVAGHADLSLSLPINNEKSELDLRNKKLFSFAREKLPKHLSEWKVSAYLNNNLFTLKILPPESFTKKLKNITFFPAQTKMIDHSGKQSLQLSDNRYIVEIPRSKYSEQPPKRLQGLLFTENGWDNSGNVKALKVDVPVKDIGNKK